jgi:putative endonuclease
MNRRRALGSLGERKAARYLRRRGMHILDRNWRCPLGELDLVVRDQECVVFVEVRTSARKYAGGPLYTVGPHKRRKLQTLAQAWLRRHPTHSGPTRFDVIGITRLSWWRFEIEWVKNAFGA